MDTTKLRDALFLAVSKDELCSWMKAPFYVDPWNAATDAHVMVGFMADQEFDECEASTVAKANVAAYLTGSMLVKTEGVLLSSEINRVMDAWPVTDECQTCHGDGSDEETDEDCAACKGVGSIEGARYPDRMHKLRLTSIGDFMPGTWSVLRAITELLSVSAWTITHGSANNGMRLVSEETPLVVVLMPAANPDESYFTEVDVTAAQPVRA